MARLLIVGLLIATITGCTSSGGAKIYAEHGKVLRGEVVSSIEDCTSLVHFVRPPSREERARFCIRRTVKVKIESEPVPKFVSAALPDNLEAGDVDRSTIVDVFVEAAVNSNYHAGRFNRVVKLVCQAHAPTCRTVSLQTYPLGSIVDSEPEDGRKYGVTYSRFIRSGEHLAN